MNLTALQCNQCEGSYVDIPQIFPNQTRDYVDLCKATSNLVSAEHKGISSREELMTGNCYKV